MTGIYEALSKGEKVEQIEQALDFIGEMVTGRPDGERYLGLYEILEAEVEELRSKIDAKARIRQRLAERSTQLAA
jgi:hypothetical protein